MRSVMLVALALAGCSAQPAPKAAEVDVPGDPRHPKVVELFQSQGCSSCPPANANLNRVANRGDLLALSFAVTYWDQLGWKDKFASPAFTQRQWDYARAAGRGNVFTPQMIFNGSKVDVGGNPEVFDRIVQDLPALGGPAIDVAKGELVVGPGEVPRPATVWLVRYDPREQQVAIKAGENRGRTLPHRNIVTELTNLGSWTGKELRLPFPAGGDAALKTAILLQSGPGGPLIGARKL
ncbi:DUF1223 domain-containing protein [Sphingomonas astaxanthinifaciens]|nr:DUF1223 domain-containing protein [Sphingomonas astaxanthinifaciens]